jgi:hypothetical protein
VKSSRAAVARKSVVVKSDMSAHSRIAGDSKMRKSIRFAAISSVALLLGWNGPAGAAQLTRAWVSGKGVDATDCGPLSRLCRQVSYVLTNNLVVAGGEVDILDPMGMQPFTITQSLSVVNDGAGTASVQGTISIAAPNATVLLRGLSIDGAATAATGISVTSAKTVDILNCVVRHFTTKGLSFAPNAPINHFSVIDSDFSDNGQAGVSVTASASVSGAVARTTLKNNGANGMFVQNTTSDPAQKIKITVVDSFATNNVDSGLSTISTVANSLVVADGFVAGNNGVAGLKAAGASELDLSRIVAAGSPIGVKILDTAQVFTLGDNGFSANASPSTGLVSWTKFSLGVVARGYR